MCGNFMCSWCPVCGKRDIEPYKKKNAPSETGLQRHGTGEHLFYFLFHVAEQVGVEELFNSDSQSIAKLLDGGNRGTVVAATDYIIDSGLGNAADATEFVDGKVLLLAQFQNALFYCFTNIYGNHFLFNKNDTHLLLKTLTLLS